MSEVGASPFELSSYRAGTFRDDKPTWPAESASEGDLPDRAA
jgi:hypothetical protein